MWEKSYKRQEGKSNNRLGKGLEAVTRLCLSNAKVTPFPAESTYIKDPFPGFRETDID